MKKLIMSAICAMLAAASFGDTNGAEVVDVYSFKATIKQPMLKNGVRTYSSATLKGDLYIEYATPTSAISRSYIVAKNSKTGVEHNIEFTDCLYNMLGKSSKQINRTVPAVYFVGTNDVVVGENAHETIRFMTVAGSGKLVKSKTKTTTCNVCAPDAVTTETCSKIKSLSGNLNGIMDCVCPEDETWDHTLIACACGLYVDINGYVRSHEAPFWGSWTAKQKK